MKKEITHIFEIKTSINNISSAVLILMVKMWIHVKFIFYQNFNNVGIGVQYNKSKGVKER